MADTNQTLLTNLKLDLTSFDTAGNGSGISNNAEKYNNDIAAVNKVLQRFLDPESQMYMQQIVDDLRKDTTNSRKDNSNPPLPTFNVRTPVVTIAINDAQIYPVDTISGADGVASVVDVNDSPARLFFQGLDISYPLGGQSTTITGSLKLFAKDPAPIIEALHIGSDKVKNSGGFPKITISWGWSLANSKIIDKPYIIKTPQLDFIATNIGFTNFETTGTDFTFTLQEIGNAICQYSSFPGIILESDYPQQQIRTILEGMLGLRLFTLDDLLYVRDKTVNDKTFFVNEKTAPVRINNNNFSVILDDLASRCRCRWYSHTNSELATTISEVSAKNDDYVKAYQELGQLKQKFKNDDPQVIKQIQKIKELQTMLASTCKLYWIPNVPKDILTTGNLSPDSLEENGAFFLLPDLSDINGDPLYTNLVYGPGASSFPYLHGSAMNVFNASLQGKQSQTFGDVLSVNVQYSNLVELLQESISENAMFVNEGNFMSSGGKIPLKQVGHNSGAAVDAELKAKVEQKYKTAVETAKKSNTVVRKNFRFTNVVRPTNPLILGDSPTIQGIDKTHTNTEKLESYTELKLRSRVNNFLKRPLTASLVILGDPTLLRLGVGGFELISYYPDTTGKTHNLNALLSGVYLTQRITHSISLTDYTTTLYGTKLAANNGILAAKVSNALVDEARTDAKDSTTTQASALIQSQFTNVDLTSKDFTTGTLSQSLRQLLNTYEQQNNIKN
jgi:hypothetical protein